MSGKMKFLLGFGIAHYLLQKFDDADKAFAEADKVVSLDTFYPRCHPAPLECCGCVADVDPATFNLRPDALEETLASLTRSRVLATLLLASTVRAQGESGYQVVVNAKNGVGLLILDVVVWVVFFALGFETTMPSTALTVLEAAAQGVRNFCVFCNHITIVPTIKAILDSPDLQEVPRPQKPGASAPPPPPPKREREAERLLRVDVELRRIDHDMPDLQSLPRIRGVHHPVRRLDDGMSQILQHRRRRDGARLLPGWCPARIHHTRRSDPALLSLPAQSHQTSRGHACPTNRSYFY